MNNVMNKIINLLRTKLENVEITSQKVSKNNGVILNGVIIKSDTNPVAPVIYVDQWIHENVSVEDIVERIIDIYLGTEYGDIPELVTKIWSYEQIKDNLSLYLISKEFNQEMLNTIPYKTFLKDLAIIVRVSFASETLDIRSIQVTQSILDRWGKSFEDVFVDAYSNFAKDESVIVSMDELLNQRCGIPAAGISLYILSNESTLGGAVRMLDEKALFEFADHMDGDLIVIPSSIHECLLMPVLGDPDLQLSETSKMVQEVNATNVLPEERLSSHAYLFRKDTGWGYEGGKIK